MSMGKGETDWTLMDAYEIKMRGIPSVLRFSDRRKLIVGGVLAAIVLVFVSSLMLILRRDLSFEVHLAAIIATVISAVIGAVILIWRVIGIAMEKKAYSEACRMAMERDIWEREKFREEFQKTVKDHNYKN